MPEERQALLARLQPLAEQTGGTLNPKPARHGRLLSRRGQSSAVVEQLQPLDRPTVAVHASGLFSFSEAPNSLLGWTLSLRVRREGGVQAGNIWCARH